jgi:hypothetical protein
VEGGLMARRTTEDGTRAPRLEPYLRKLRSVHVVFMSDQELGMVLTTKNDVVLWPYRVSTAEDLLQVFTHEVVHLVRPDLNEAAVEAAAVGLCRRAAWRSAALAVLADHLLLRLHRAKAKAGYVVDD